MNKQAEISREKAPKAIWEALETVIDPEMYISIVDLGLVYEIDGPQDGLVTITMTLTTLGCPLFPVIERDIREAVAHVTGVTDVKINLVFDPPWGIERMTEKGKAVLGI